MSMTATVNTILKEATVSSKALMTGVDVTVHDLFETMFKVQNKQVRIISFGIFLVKIR